MAEASKTTVPSQPAAAVQTITADDMVRLLDAARSAATRRARLCLHTSHADPIQEMVIAFCRDSLVPPHRHRQAAGSHGSESYRVLDGQLTLMLFNDDGEVRERHRLSADRLGVSCLRLHDPTIWHTLVVESPHAIVHEVRSGPFHGEPLEVPPWCPDKPAELARFLAQAAGGDR